MHRDIVYSFGEFMKKQNLCEESAWTTFFNHVEEYSKSKTVQEGEDIDSDLRHLIKELNGFLPSDTREPEPIPGDQPRCVGELVIKSEPQEAPDSGEEGKETQPMDEESAATPIEKEEKQEEEINEKEKERPAIDPSLVQITASKAEIDRRVAAFQEHTRLEVNEGNIREFRSAMSSEEACESSARTDATFLKRPNSKSRVQVSRVVNQYGPQTRRQPDLTGGDAGTTAAPPGSGSVTEGVEERLSNMEQHVGVAGGGKPKSPSARAYNPSHLKTRKPRHHFRSHQPNTDHPVSPSQHQKGPKGKSIEKGLDSDGIPAASSERVAWQRVIRHQQPPAYQLGSCRSSPMLSYQRPMYYRDKEPSPSPTGGASTMLQNMKMTSESCLDGDISKGRRSHKENTKQLADMGMYTNTSIDRVSVIEGRGGKRKKSINGDGRTMKCPLKKGESLEGDSLGRLRYAEDLHSEGGKSPARDSTDKTVSVTDARHRAETLYDNLYHVQMGADGFVVCANSSQKRQMSVSSSEGKRDKVLATSNRDVGEERKTNMVKGDHINLSNRQMKRHLSNPETQRHAALLPGICVRAKKKRPRVLVVCGMVFEKRANESSYSFTGKRRKSYPGHIPTPNCSPIIESKVLETPTKSANKPRVSTPKHVEIGEVSTSREKRVGQQHSGSTETNRRVDNTAITSKTSINAKKSPSTDGQKSIPSCTSAKDNTPVNSSPGKGLPDHYDENIPIGNMLQQLWPENISKKSQCPEPEQDLKKNVIYDSDKPVDIARTSNTETSGKGEFLRECSGDESVSSSEDTTLRILRQDETMTSGEDESWRFPSEDASVTSSLDESMMSSGDASILSSGDEWVLPSNYESTMSSEYETATRQAGKSVHNVSKKAKPTHVKAKNAKSANKLSAMPSNYESTMASECETVSRQTGGIGHNASKRAKSANKLKRDTKGIPFHHQTSSSVVIGKDRRRQRESGSLPKPTRDLSNLPLTINTQKTSLDSRRSSVYERQPMQSDMRHVWSSNIYFSSSEDDTDDFFVTLSSQRSFEGPRSRNCSGM